MLYLSKCLLVYRSRLQISPSTIFLTHFLALSLLFSAGKKLNRAPCGSQVFPLLAPIQNSWVKKKNSNLKNAEEISVWVCHWKGRMSSLCFSGILAQMLMVVGKRETYSTLWREMFFHTERSAGHCWWTFLPGKSHFFYFSICKGGHFIRGWLKLRLLCLYKFW